MKKIILVGGCFDLIHYGHIKFLKEAKKLGDFLIVALESDANVKKYKGSKRPIHIQAHRSEMLKSLNMVDQVVSLPEMHEDKDYFDMVTEIKPHIIATTDMDPQMENKKKQAEEVGGKLIVVTPLVTPYSTSLLLQEI